MALVTAHFGCSRYVTAATVVGGAVWASALNLSISVVNLDRRSLSVQKPAEEKRLIDYSEKLLLTIINIPVCKMENNKIVSTHLILVAASDVLERVGKPLKVMNCLDVSQRHKSRKVSTLTMDERKPRDETMSSCHVVGWHGSESDCRISG
ncbi:hypothetical protein J6590_017517 [Homalodisca vitripennis]|nr:hypothetical protein J6590_017517 [Homalodisca vitripennis]